MPEWFKRLQAGDEKRQEAKISNVSVGGGAAGLLVTLLVLAIILVGLPTARWFFAASLALGVILALILRFIARGRG